MQNRKIISSIITSLIVLFVSHCVAQAEAIVYPPGSHFLTATEVPVIFTEIMYHPGDDNDGGEYLELTNRSGSAVDLDQWSVDGSVSYRFESPRPLQPGESFVLCKDHQRIQSSYGLEGILGSYQGKLANEGERIRLLDPNGFAVLTITYQPTWPWPAAADGLGYSLALKDIHTDPTLPENWGLGSPYSPGQINNAIELEESGDVVINEIMYHALSENENHEYIELYNNTDQSIDMTGWQLCSAIEYVFPAGTQLSPKGYLVLARSISDFLSYYPAAPGPITGDYKGKLSNAGETIGLYDARGTLVDVVAYGDGGRWPELADGLGSSLELRHPNLHNGVPEAWVDSTSQSSPGQRNTSWQADPAPIVELQRHDPAVPTPSDAVTVYAQVFDNDPIDNVILYYITGRGQQTVPMTRQGNNQWAGTIPRQTENQVVEFYVKATDQAGQSSLAPLGAPDENALVQVDSVVHPTPREIYRIVMTPETYDGKDQSLMRRNTNSNVLLNCTFIVGNEIRYNAGIRLRGMSSRNFAPPKNLRVQFTRTDQPFRQRERLNLNGVDDDPRSGNYEYAIASHMIGHDFMARAGQVALDRQLISLVIDNEFWPNYIYLSPMDDAFARWAFPGDDGNLYGCVRQDSSSSPYAALDYRGTNPDVYRFDYFKKTNEAEDDWTDLIELTCILDRNCTPDNIFLEKLPERVDIHQWMRYFASMNLIGFEEGGITASLGSEYNMYSRASDGQFVLIPWDFDALFDKHVNITLFTQKLPPVKRFIQHPDLVQYYYQAFEDLLAGPYSEDEMRTSVERYRGLLQDEFLDEIMDFVGDRSASVRNQLPQTMPLVSKRWFQGDRVQ